MYLNNIIIENMGAIEKFQLLKKDLIKEDGSPRVVILVGQNGSGKTTLLSSIVDAFHRFSNDKFNGILKKDGINNIEFKVIGMKNVRVSCDYGFSYLQFLKKKAKTYEYFDKSGSLSYIESQKKTNNLLTLKFKNTNANYKLHTNVTHDNSFMVDFMHNTYAYFPSDRFEVPYWSTKYNEYSTNFNSDKPYNNTLGKNIVIRENINQIKNWIINVFLDKLVKHDDEYHEYYAHSLKNIEYLLSVIIEKDILLELNLRTSVSDRLKIVDKETKEDILLSLNNLSAGQSTLLSIFLNIIKSSDKINIHGSIFLKDIEGIVLIDEIDLHLHIYLQTVVLPSLIKLFPKVQFIVTSHSPFFLNGMSKNFKKDDYIVVNMPSGKILDTYDEFEEFNRAYEVFDTLTNEKREEIKELQAKVSEFTKPVIITEGKTDWKHFKRALSHFQENGEFTSLDVEFMEYEDDLKMSESQLEKLITELSKVSRPNKVIGIFDCDTVTGKHYKDAQKQKLSSHVYGLAIPTPSFRDYHTGICTEFLYKDEDLKKLNEDGRRIYLSEEFSKKGRLQINKKIGLENATKVKGKNSKEKSIIIDSGIVDIDENSLALSKDAFSKHVLENDKPFDTMDFEGFRGLFNEIVRLLS